jgi:hypothetical protein
MLDGTSAAGRGLAAVWLAAALARPADLDHQPTTMIRRHARSVRRDSGRRPRAW